MPCRSSKCILMFLCARSGVIHPEDGDIVKSNGRRVLNFGPIKEWKIVYSNSGAQVQKNHTR